MFGRRNVLTGCVAAAVTALVIQANAAEEKSITVFAAASLKNALDEVDSLFSKQSGIKIVASYAASSSLMKQIEQGAPADVFLSADIDWMDYGIKRNLIKTDTRENLLGNRLVLIAPKDFEDRQRDHWTWFRSCGARRLRAHRDRRRARSPGWPLCQSGAGEARHLAERGIKNSHGRKRACGAGPRCSRRGTARHRLSDRRESRSKCQDRRRISRRLHPPIIYPVAMTKDAKPDAEQYLAFLTTTEAKAVFERYGFRVLAKPTQ